MTIHKTDLRTNSLSKCGTWTGAFDFIVKDWNRVDCKKCLKYRKKKI